MASISITTAPVFDQQESLTGMPPNVRCHLQNGHPHCRSNGQHSPPADSAASILTAPKQSFRSLKSSLRVTRVEQTVHQPSPGGNDKLKLQLLAAISPEACRLTYELDWLSVGSLLPGSFVSTSPELLEPHGGTKTFGSSGGGVRSTCNQSRRVGGIP